MQPMHMEVALFGAAGYAGLELAKLLATHPHVKLACVASDTHAGKPVGELTGRDHGPLTFVTTDEARTIAARCGLALLAVPPEPAKLLAAPLREAGCKVIDLSHAHRGAPGAVYGLTSLFSDEIRNASLIANPGCYATAVIIACAPLVRYGLVDGLFAVSAGSGVTGAGRTGADDMSLGEMYGEVRAYKVLRHQHVPEIETSLARCGTVSRVVLTTHLLPVARGIFATVTAQLASPIASDALVQRFRADYSGDPTVVIARTPEEVSLRRVVGTYACMLGVATDERGALVVTVALDNLLKGAASQAIENLNVMLGVSRTAGLEHLARHA